MGIDHYHTDPKDDDLDFCIEKEVERSTSGSLTIFIQTTFSLPLVFFPGYNVRSMTNDNRIMTLVRDLISKTNGICDMTYFRQLGGKLNYQG